MAYLIDSDVLIYYVNDVPGAQELVETLMPERVAVSVIGYLEAVEGLSRSVNAVEATARFNALMLRVPVVSFTVQEALRCALVRDELRRSNRSIRSRALDLIVAATALEHGLILVTNNHSDYRDISDLVVLPAQIMS